MSSGGGLKHKPHWYFKTIFECPICGCTKEYRKRYYTEKPADPRDRFEWIDDACQGHFL